MERLEWLGVLAKQVLSQLSYMCQLARVGRSSGSSSVRLRGPGGDGGVECYADLADDNRAALVEEAVERGGDDCAVAQQFSLISTRRPTRDVSDHGVLSSTWQSPTTL
jgi:hypothetical protein